MLLIADVLNSNAELNDFEVIKTLDFIPGYEFKLAIRLKQHNHDKLRYVADSGSTLNVRLQNKDGSVLTVAMSAFTDDRSMWSGTITAEQSHDIYGGNFTFELTEGSDLTPGYVENGLALIVTGDC